MKYVNGRNVHSSLCYMIAMQRKSIFCINIQVNALKLRNWQRAKSNISVTHMNTRYK